MFRTSIHMAVATLQFKTAPENVHIVNCVSFYGYWQLSEEKRKTEALQDCFDALPRGTSK